ncbi:hypothetical protein SNEBB_001128 [Seison nebaliae]|nr:hypothetical protein SNEBB_001128 [Seison nebaliae]
MEKLYKVLVLFDRSKCCAYAAYFHLNDYCHDNNYDEIFPGQFKFPIDRIANLKNYRSIVVHNQLYVLGGQCASTVQVMSSMIKYCPITNKWHNMPSMLTGRKNFEILKLNQLIIVSGGQNRNDEILTSIEYFDTIKEKWYIGGQLLKGQLFPSVTATYVEKLKDNQMMKECHLRSLKINRNIIDNWDIGDDILKQRIKKRCTRKKILDQVRIIEEKEKRQKLDELKKEIKLQNGEIEGNNSDDNLTAEEIELLKKKNASQPKRPLHEYYSSSDGSSSDEDLRMISDTNKELLRVNRNKYGKTKNQMTDDFHLLFSGGFNLEKKDTTGVSVLEAFTFSNNIQIHRFQEPILNFTMPLALHKHSSFLWRSNEMYSQFLLIWGGSIATRTKNDNSEIANLQEYEDNSSIFLTKIDKNTENQTTWTAINMNEYFPSRSQSGFYYSEQTKSLYVFGGHSDRMINEDISRQSEIGKQIQERSQQFESRRKKFIEDQVKHTKNLIKKKLAELEEMAAEKEEDSENEFDIDTELENYKTKVNKDLNDDFEKQFDLERSKATQTENTFVKRTKTIRDRQKFPRRIIRIDLEKISKQLCADVFSSPYELEDGIEQCDVCLLEIPRSNISFNCLTRAIFM